MITETDLLEMSRHHLRDVLHAGHAIDPSAIEDREYCGVSLGLPGFVEQLTWKTFTKVFHRDTERDVLRGWNVRTVQNGLEGEWKPMMKRGRPHTFGHFEVVDAANRHVPPGCDRGLLLDYGAGLNGVLDPIGALRDPLVAVNAGDADLLLGWSYLEVGRKQVPTPSFFSLKRGKKLTHHAEPPRG